MSRSQLSCLLLTRLLGWSFRRPVGAWPARIQLAFNNIFTSSLKATSPIKYLHCAGMVLIRQWFLTSMQSREETGHSNVRWEYQNRYLIYQLLPRKAYVKAVEELNSLFSWEAHRNVSGRSFPQDVRNRWFNHVKFLVLVTWRQPMPSPPTTTGTFHNPNEQHVYHVLLTESWLSPSMLS